MVKSNDIIFDLYGENITNYPNSKISPYNCPPGHKKHDNPQNIMLFSCYDKAAQTVNYLAHCQNIFQKNLERNAHDNFQMERHNVVENF